MNSPKAPLKALPDPDVVDGKIVKVEKNTHPSDDEWNWGYGDEVTYIDGDGT